jgi:predicted metal-dependent hydrolase
MGQLEFDLRLDYERSLKDNLIAVTKFAGEQMKQNLEDEGRPLKAVESKQEAYGIAAQQFVKVCTKEKALKGQMDDFLKLLDADGEATQVAGTIYNAAMELAQESILMAAQASRILADLYYTEPRTPLEEYMEAEGTEDTEQEGDE